MAYRLDPIPCAESRAAIRRRAAPEPAQINELDMTKVRGSVQVSGDNRTGAIGAV